MNTPFDDPFQDFRKALDAADAAGQVQRMMDAASGISTLAAATATAAAVSLPTAAEAAAIRAVVEASTPSPAEVAVMNRAIAASIPSPAVMAGITRQITEAQRQIDAVMGSIPSAVLRRW